MNNVSWHKHISFSWEQTSVNVPEISEAFCKNKHKAETMG